MVRFGVRVRVLVSTATKLCLYCGFKLTDIKHQERHVWNLAIGGAK